LRRIETIGDATLYLGDSRDLVPTLGPADAVITSPPYGQQRDYGEKISDWRALVSTILCGVVDAGKTQILVNLGLIHRDGSVVPYWNDLISDMQANGWRLFGWYVWDQGPGMPGDWQGRCAPAYEFIFHFNKQARKPNKTTPAKYAGHVRSKPPGGLRLANGDMSGWCHGLAPTQDNKIPDSVFRVTRHKHVGGIESGHPAIYPVDFANELILAYSDGAEVILDPFMGSGTTGVACANLGRKFIGIEIEPKYFDIACRRIEEAYRQPRLFSEPAPKPQQLSILDEAS
jgi:DNA modification methylase